MPRDRAEFDDVLEDGHLEDTFTIGTSPVEIKVGASIMDGRELVIVHNDSDDPVFHGSATVTVATGIPILSGVTMAIPAGRAVYLVAGSAGNVVRGHEIG